MSGTPTLAVARELCLLRPAARTAPELLTLLAGRAVEAGYAAPTFVDALLQRERDYPTGLPLPTPAAIPHADAVHVLRPALAAAWLDPPVEFGEMGGGDDRTVACRLVVMLLVDTPDAQVDVLGRVLAALRRPGWAQRLADSTDADDLAVRTAELFA